MSLKKKSLSFTFLALAGLFGLILIQPVSAQVPSDFEPIEFDYDDGWAYWSTDVWIENGRPVGQMQIVIGHTKSNGVDVQDFNQWFEIDCAFNHEGVEVDENSAVFDGDDYIHCDLFNFKETVAAITNHNLIIDDECDCKDTYFKVRFEADLIHGQANPIMWTDAGASFSLPTSTSGPMSTYVTMVIDGIVAQTDNVALHGVMESYLGLFSDNANGGYEPVFASENAGSLHAYPANIGSPLYLQTNTSELIIGFNPDTKKFAKGKFESGIIDPPCFGRGGI